MSSSSVRFCARDNRQQEFPSDEGGDVPPDRTL